MSTFITEALLTAVDAGETRLGLEERGLASGMKVTDKADGQRRVGYTPTAEHGEVDALHRLGILAQLAKKSVLVEVGSVGLEWEEAA